MWYHKTKLGTFWIVESEKDHRYYLGMDEDSLGIYDRLDQAIHDIKAQETGCLKWDQARNSDIPEDIREWVEGEPDDWSASAK